jgi:beta-lactamase regulating signal transducer with metallopeptidase domain
MDVSRFALDLFAAAPEWAWKGAALLAVAVIADFALRHRAAALRHLVWSGTLAGLLALPLAQPLLPELALPLPLAMPAAPAGLADGPAAAATVATLSRAELAAPGGSDNPAFTGEGEKESCALGGPAAKHTSHLAAGGPASSGAPSIALAPGPELSAHGSEPSRPLGLASLAPFAPSLLPLVWALGALAVTVRLGASLLRRRRLLATARPLGPEWQELAAIAARRLGVGRRFRLLASVETEVPMTWGVFSPVVLLPALAGRWPTPQRRTVLLHELAHVRRVDALGLAVSQLACIVHWFDPLAWLAAYRLRAQAEHACDDLVLLAGSRPSLYAGHLVEIARALRSALPSPAVTLPMARRAQLSDRVAAILDEARERRAVSRLAAGVVALLACLLVVPLAAVRPRPTVPPAAVVAPAAPVARTAAAAPIAGPVLPLPPSVPSTPKVAPPPPLCEDCGTTALAPVPPAPGAPNTPSVPPAPWSSATGTPTPAAAPVVAASDAWAALHAAAPPAPPAPPAVVSAPAPVAPAHPVTAPVAAPVAAPRSPPAPPAPPAPPRHGFSYRTGGEESGLPGWASCSDASKRHRSASVTVDDDGDWKVRLREGRCRLDVDLTGDVAFAADESGIARVGRNGRLRIFEDRPGAERELVATGGTDGRPLVTWQVDGLRRPFDDEGRAWLARLGPELFRQTGIDAASRVGRILARGGVDAVLAEVKHIPSDNIAALYLRELLRQGKPSPQQIERIVGLAAREIESDHELSQLLLAGIETHGAEAVVSPAFHAACDALDSDHDTHRVLLAVVRQAQRPATVESALRCLRRVESDHDTSQVLVAVAARWPVGRELPESFFETARRVASDHDRKRVLEAAAARRPLLAADVRDILATAPTFRSSHDLAELLVAVARAGRLQGAQATAYLEAAERIGSEHDRNRAIAAMARQAAY